MSALRTAVQVLSVAVGMSCSAAINDLQRSISSFPEISAEHYRPDVAVASANALIAAGKETACAELDEAARSRSDLSNKERINDKICHLCRLVFTSANSSEPLRPPRLGALSGMPYEGLKPPDWPDIPFVIINDVPLSMSLGYAGSGIPERSANYLAYCKANGSFRTKLFARPTSITASNALNQVFSAPAWKALKWKAEGLGWHYTIDEDDVKERLRKQVESMANKTVQRTGASR